MRLITGSLTPCARSRPAPSGGWEIFLFEFLFSRSVVRSVYSLRLIMVDMPVWFKPNEADRQAQWDGLNDATKTLVASLAPNVVQAAPIAPQVPGMPSKADVKALMSKEAVKGIVEADPALDRRVKALMAGALMSETPAAGGARVELLRLLGVTDMDADVGTFLQVALHLR